MNKKKIDLKVVPFVCCCGAMCPGCCTCEK